MIAWNRAVVAVLAGPTSLWVLSLYPPWPQGGGLLYAISAIFASAIMLVVFAPHLNARGRQIAGVGAMVMLLVYIALYIVFVENVRIGVTEGRVLIGYEYLRLEMSAFTAQELFKRYGLDPSAIWTRSSLNIVRISAMLSFLGMLSTATLAIASRPKNPVGLRG